MSDSGTTARVPNKTKKNDPVKWRIASGTKIQTNHPVAGKLCDFMVQRAISGGIPLLLVAEFKSRPKHMSDILDQLQRGADLIQKSGIEGPFAALLVKSRGINPDEIRVLKQRKIKFRGSEFPVRVENHLVNLADLVLTSPVSLTA